MLKVPPDQQLLVPTRFTVSKTPKLDVKDERMYRVGFLL